MFHVKGSFGEISQLPDRQKDSTDSQSQYFYFHSIRMASSRPLIKSILLLETLQS